MTENEKWIKQSCEREELAKKLIEMGVKDIDEFDELKNVPMEILQTWVIEALEEENDILRKKLHKAEQKEFELFFDKEVANA
jgi:hypothetical protein